VTPVLDPWMVRSARDLVALGEASAAELAEDYGVPTRTMQHAVYGTSWKEIPGAVRSHQKPTRRLAPSEVLEIVENPDPSPAVAERYGIADSPVRHIRTGRTWGWLTGLTPPTGEDS
jgi:hypothetical protein